MNNKLENAKKLLKKYFGYENFRTGQEEIISHILNCQDCLGIMPTGAGKSICYQIPAMLLEGTCLVISPLISLMKDQVDNLNQIGIPATFLNSSLTSKEYLERISNILNEKYKIIYVAPERLESESFFQILQKLNISLIAIDEAHCVSRWGHDFRPSYTKIANIILNLKTRPIVSAFTATATELVKKDILSLLHLNNPFCLTTGFDRKNLSFNVKTVENRKKFIYTYVRTHINDSGIIYCLTRKSVDDIYDNLARLGVNVSKYHAGMSDKQRTENQNDFVYDKTSVIVATNAFGMGIDKSNIRYVIHYNMPRDLESYYQEAGRAGRDGDLSNCILLFNRSDIVTNKYLIELGTSNTNHSNEYQKLNDMVDYCNTDKCLRKYILEYFGETPEFDNCHNCSNCNSDVEITDITIDSKKILSCIKRMNERFGIGLVTDVLKGSKTAKIKTLGFNTLSTYGILHDYSKSTIKNLISFLITEGYIKNIGDKYPVLNLTNNANDVLFNNKPVFIKRKIEKLTDENSNININSNITRPIDEKLFELLKNLRRDISYKSNVPPFLIFSDISLKEMASNYPISTDSFLNINGVGKYKMERYGYDFLDTIRNYVKDNNIDVYWDKKTTTSTKVTGAEKENTRKLSYNLYIQGKSIEEITNIRKLTKQTIQNHLLDCFKEGLELDLEKEIHTNYEKQIYEAIEKYGTQKLKPLKEALPEEVSYLDIRYYITIFETKLKTNK